MTLRAPLQRIVDELLARSGAGGDVSLDEIGEALGVTAATQDEIDAMMRALEAAGRRIRGPEGARGEETLRIVLDVARAMRGATGRAPSAQEIAARTGLDLEQVRHALALARVIAK